MLHTTPDFIIWQVDQDHSAICQADCVDGIQNRRLLWTFVADQHQAEIRVRCENELVSIQQNIMSFFLHESGYTDQITGRAWAFDAYRTGILDRVPYCRCSRTRAEFSNPGGQSLGAGDHDIGGGIDPPVERTSPSR